MIKKYKATSPGRRHMSHLKSDKITSDKPHKGLVKPKKKITGRNNAGKITVRHRGGAQKRKLRIIDFKRDKIDVPAKVEHIEYDPNRSANIALLLYADGERRYIIAPEELSQGDKVISSDKADLKPGNVKKIKDIPVGTPIHNIELRAGKGGQMVRSAGSSALVQSKEKGYATIIMPSKEARLVSLDCRATIGQVSNPEWKNVSWGKAGRMRHRGFRPSVRGTAQHPASHPHGGGEGRSGIGLKAPKTPWGKRTLGVKTRKKKKYSDKYIVRDRRVK